MVASEVSRSPFRIVQNNLPSAHLGQLLREDLRLGFRIKPAYDNPLIIVLVSPYLSILDGRTNIEIFRFQTETLFQFSGDHSSLYIQNLIYQIICLGIDEFNDALHNTKSLLAVGRTITKLSFAEMEPTITQALNINYQEVAGIQPHWRAAPPSSAIDNEELIATMPILPPCKVFQGNVTPEQQAMTASFASPTPSSNDLQILSAATSFYKSCFAQLDKLDLSKLTQSQAEKLKFYLNTVFTATPFLANDLTVQQVFRATILRDDFLEAGKLRNSQFLSYAPLDVIRKRGVFNRCSSPNRTLFYATEAENVSIREVKPAKGKRVIVSTWINLTGATLHHHPLCLAPGISNAISDGATAAFEQLHSQHHPIVIEWMRTVMSFVTKEFIKESDPIHPQRYDYFFSAFFSDRNLEVEGMPGQSIDCIVYPSVAWNHVPTNLAILPRVIDSIFRLIKAVEYEVEDTWYGKSIPLHEYPAKLRFIRESTTIKDGRITWNDDAKIS